MVLSCPIGMAGRGPIPGVRIQDAAELPEAFAALGLAGPRPVLVLVGGAANLDQQLAYPLLNLFESLAPWLQRTGTVVIDGGTAYGVMELIGLARRRTGNLFPLVGVAAIGTVEVPSPEVGVPTGTSVLDPNHSHFILVPGCRWGDESPWISAAAEALADGMPTLTLVAAGGNVTGLDVTWSLRAGRPVGVIAGTGGTADRLADWGRGGDPPTGMALGEKDLRLIRTLALEDPGGVGDLICEILGP
jgi:hypothetical protein